MKSKASRLDHGIEDMIGDYEKSIVRGEFLDNENLYTEVLDLQDDAHCVETDQT